METKLVSRKELEVLVRKCFHESNRLTDIYDSIMFGIERIYKDDDSEVEEII